MLILSATVPLPGAVVVAQDAVVLLSGAVLDSATGQPLSDVAVYVSFSSAADRTNSAGKFRLRGLTSGPRSLLLLKRGYGSRVITVDVPEDHVGEWSVGTIRLTEDAIAADSAAVLTGVVLDSLTWSPIADVTIRLVGGTAADRSNLAGEFTLHGVPPGSHTVALTKVGYLMKAFQFVVSREQNGPSDLGPILIAGGRSARMSVVGTLVDARTGLPVDKAVVSVNGSGTVSGRDGRFVVADVEVYDQASNLLEVRRLGYVPHIREFDSLADADSVIRLNVALEALPVQLSEVVVEGDRVRYVSNRRLRDFFERRKAGWGSYVTREEIEERQPRVLTDMLRTLPGLAVTTDSNGRLFLRSVRNPRCRSVAVYLDGLLIPGADAFEIDMLVPPEEIVGVEVYGSALRVPIEYGGGSACGVILIWTR